MKIVARFRMATGWFFRLNDENGPTLTEEQAAHIVRCVNAHDELVTALRLARKAIDGYPRSFGYDFDALPTIDAALAKVEAA